MSSAKTIVILGAGFGGLRCALTLEKLLRKHKLQDTAEIILIDKNRYHTFIPSLYEVASASPNVSEDALYHRANILIKHLIRRKRITFIKAEISKINLEKKHVEFSDGAGQEFDYLVVALGSETHFYGIPGLKEHSLQLKDFIDALRIRRSMKLADAVPQKIVIAGGGTTGVELSAELHSCLSQAGISISIIEGAGRILPTFTENVSHLAAKRLQTLGIKVLLGHFIKAVEQKGILLDNGARVPYDVLLWSAGIKGHHLFEGLPLKKEKNGILKSDSCLHPLKENDDSVDFAYIIGDAASFYDHKGHPIPWTAQKAINEGKKVAYTLFRLLQGLHETKHYPEKTRFIIPIGGKWAIAHLHSFTHVGFFGWVLKDLVELKYLFSMLPFPSAFYHWARAMMTFSRND